jgi:hypothetical protein
LLRREFDRYHQRPRTIGECVSTGTRVVPGESVYRIARYANVVTFWV